MEGDGLGAQVPGSTETMARIKNWLVAGRSELLMIVFLIDDDRLRLQQMMLLLCGVARGR